MVAEVVLSAETVTKPSLNLKKYTKCVLNPIMNIFLCELIDLIEIVWMRNRQNIAKNMIDLGEILVK